jgi:hypothetical protein
MKTFLSQFGLDTLRQLPDLEAIQGAGLLSKASCWPGIFRLGWPIGRGEDEVVGEQVS